MKDFIQNPPTEVVKYPDPILLQKAQPVSEINEDVKQACNIMFDLMYKFRGVGLAGPQAGLPYRIFVANHTGDKGKERVFINPEILSTGNRTSTEEEGCLSIPGVRVPVTRPHKVTLQAYGLDGKLNKYTFEGLMGRICQHECLPSFATVQCEDGQYRSIKNIVDSKYDGRILGLDLNTLTAAWTKILGSTRKKNYGKVWISLICGKSCRAGRRLICTEDHLCAVTELYKDSIQFIEAQDSINNFLVRQISKSSHNENALYNEDQISLIVGSLLGDGHISERGVFSITQGQSQQKYLDWKSTILGNGNRNVCKSGYKDENSVLLETFPVTVQTHDLRNKWYAKKEKIADLSIIDEKALAIWYMDDGYGSKKRYVTLHTEGFGKIYVESLSEFLHSKWGIRSIVNYRSSGKAYIYIRSSSLERFFNLISPFMSPTMKYKLPEKFTNELSFSYAWNTQKRGYSAKKIIDIKQSRKESALFDLKTETSNFFANNSLVHNCDHLEGILIGTL